MTNVVNTPEEWGYVWVGYPAAPPARVSISHSLSAAYDLLVDDGYLPEKAARMAVSAQRAGLDPEALARKVRRLRREMG